ncbi:hypothetical protein AAC387_Pa10g0185 [Persea americana]
MPSLHNVPPLKQPRHSKEHTMRGDKSVTKLGEKAQNRLIQEQEELIRQLKQQLQERRGARSPPPVRSHASGPPPRHDQAPPPSHERDLRHIFNKRRDRVHDEEGSSNSRVHASPKKQRQLPEDKAKLKQ